MSTSGFFDHFEEHFSGLNGPRLERMKRHSLKDILLLTILGAICLGFARDICKDLYQYFIVF